MNYKVKADNKLHTNYSSLKRCTNLPAALSVVRESQGQKKSFDNQIVRFGRNRHLMWEKQSRQTGYTPEEFARFYKQPVDYIEQAFAVEIFKDVVIHFRPDAVSIADQAVIDYKKVVGSGRQFLPSKQLIIYAYGLQLHGIKITKRVYLCEKWNADSTEILGYQVFELPLTLAEIGMAPHWIKSRAALLKAVTEQYVDKPLHMERTSL